MTSNAPFLVAVQAGQASTLILLAPGLVSDFHTRQVTNLPPS